MDRNKTGKYIKYAIGEIILVVIGILCAISINNWNQDYQNSKKELLILKKIRTNIQADTTAFNNKITEYESNLNKLTIINNEISNDKLAKFSINIIEPLLGTARMNLETTTWENLKSTGEINLIKNDELTDHLQDYYIQYKNNSALWIEGFNEYSRNIIAPKFFELDDFSMFAPNSEYLDEDIQNTPPYTYGQNILFRNVLRYRKGASQSIINNFETDLERAGSILNMLNDEINK